MAYILCLIYLSYSWQQDQRRSKRWKHLLWRTFVSTEGPVLEMRGWFIIIDVEEWVEGLNVCSEQFAADCSVNQAQFTGYKAGFTIKLLQKMIRKLPNCKMYHDVKRLSTSITKKCFWGKTTTTKHHTTQKLIFATVYGPFYRIRPKSELETSWEKKKRKNISKIFACMN